MPKNVRSSRRVAYHAVIATPISAAIQTVQPTQAGAGPWPSVACAAATSTFSLDQKPASGGIPARAPSPLTHDQNVTGMLRRRPPIRHIEFVSTAWITAPAARNSSALNAAWVSRWNSAAAGQPTASAPVMYPIWLTVDQARTRLMSCWAQAANAPSSMVIAAITASTCRVAGAAANSGYSLATTYTPAATIVAAWISAEIGVGPAIASGSQVCSGNWALLPATPASRSSSAAVRVAGWYAYARILVIWNVPAE